MAVKGLSQVHGVCIQCSLLYLLRFVSIASQGLMSQETLICGVYGSVN